MNPNDLQVYGHRHDILVSRVLQHRRWFHPNWNIRKIRQIKIQTTFVISQIFLGKIVLEKIRENTVVPYCLAVIWRIFLR